MPRCHLKQRLDVLCSPKAPLDLLGSLEQFFLVLIFRYKCPKEDSNRNHYEPWELRIFENLECQWPMFYCFFVINAYFMGDFETGEKYAKHLDVSFKTFTLF